MNYSTGYGVITPDGAQSFLRDGYVVVKNCIERRVCDEWVRWAFERLGYDETEPSTWDRQRIHLGPDRKVDVARFSPKAYAATCDVVGSEERLWTPYIWGDTFVVNLAEGADRPFEPASALSPGWHKDGYFFRHFLDSPEQGLLTVVAWTDIRSTGGATFVAPDSVGVVARYLADHPEGVEPGEFGALIGECRDFRELTASAGDIVLIHPFMLHAVSQNVLRRPRIITNPPLFLRGPMRFDRSRYADHSLVEQAVLRALGVNRYKFTPTGERRSDYPQWVIDAQRALAGI